MASARPTVTPRLSWSAAKHRRHHRAGRCLRNVCWLSLCWLSGGGGFGPIAGGPVGLRADEPAISASTGEVVLQLGDWPAVERLVKAAARPAVVDVWSTSCQPCMKEFPNLVKLHQELGDRVLCLSLCSDYVGLKKRPPESYRDRALEFLKQQEATLVNVLSSQPDTDLYDAIGIESIPAVLVFDQQGNLAHRFVDAGETVGFTYSKQVIPAVRALLPPEEAP